MRWVGEKRGQTECVGRTLEVSRDRVSPADGWASDAGHAVMPLDCIPEGRVHIRD